METTRPVRYERPGISQDNIDPAAMRVIRRLAESGAPALLVGGCVRDLLLGRKPKDFDVVTPLSLRRVRRIFRSNSRVIGRRHRLVHVFFEDGKIIEVSTYPRPDEDEETLPADAEVLDAERRDFTVNALYYDPLSDTLLDYVDGFRDVEGRVLRAIGPAREKLLEDPVRIVRGVRYSTFLDFTIERETGRAMRELAWTVAQANKRRMQEELWKFLLAPRTGRAFRVFGELGVFAILFPEIRRFLDPEGPGHLWEYLDSKDDVPPAALTPTLATAILFLPLLDEIENLGAGDPEEESRLLAERCRTTVEPIGRIYSLARKVRYGIEFLLQAQLRLVRGPGGRRHRIMESIFFDPALELFRVFCRANSRFAELVPLWAEAAKDVDRLPPAYEPDTQRRRRRRRRRRTSSAP